MRKTIAFIAASLLAASAAHAGRIPNGSSLGNGISPDNRTVTRSRIVIRRPVLPRPGYHNGISTRNGVQLDNGASQTIQPRAIYLELPAQDAAN